MIDEKLRKKCNEIIESLKDYTLEEKYKVVTSLYSSFMDICEEEGITFIELQNGMVEKEKN